MADTKIEPQVEESPIINGKLYGIYSVISHKTTRQNEKYFVRYFKRNKECKGFLCKTGRGYFIDGYNVDLKSVQDWALMNESKPGAGDGLSVFKPHNK